MKFTGPALPSNAEDFERVAKALNVDVAAVRSVVAVETRGRGFDSHDRPKMLFEPHIFYRLLTGEARQEAVRKKLAYPRWGERPYPKDSYPRLEQAMAIDSNAALQACSWGIGQILGQNHKMIGCASVQDMISAACESEGKQLDQMGAYIKADNLDGSLRKHDWGAFAHKYNGPTERRNGYDRKLAAAYRRQPPSAPRIIKDHPLTVYEIQALQEQLRDLGYHEIGVIDGKWGSRTIAALSAFQHESNLPTTGVLDAATKAALQTAPKRPMAPERLCATSVPGSRTETVANLMKSVGGATAALSTGAELFPHFNPLIPVWQLIAAHPFWFMFVLSTAAVAGAEAVRWFKVDDFRNGRMA